MTTNITLDTSFIVSQNFLCGTLINEYGKKSKDKTIKVFITDITYREVLSQFRQKLTKANEGIKKPKNLLEGQAKILRNFGHMKGYFTLPEVDVSKLFEEFEHDFDNFLKDNRIIIIPTDHLSIGRVFNDYFSTKPPFGTGDKKHEFPDAFSTLATEEFFKTRTEKTYLITSDNGLATIESSVITMSNEPEQILDQLIRLDKEIKTKQSIEFIEGLFVKKKEKLAAELKEEIYRILEDEVGSGGGRYDLEIEDVDYIDLGDIRIDNHSIIHIDKNKAKLQLEISFGVDISITASDLNSGFYDKEDNKWLFVEQKELRVSKDTINSNAILSIDFHPAAGQEYADFEIDSVNEGKDFDILRDA
ncbi:MAG TPA: PIN domain-containing protein [Cyclobacteriaceae bacterium]|nr:PIN domain-containing protein [Cyclobacteriaceae bacterium]